MNGTKLYLFLIRCYKILFQKYLIHIQNIGIAIQYNLNDILTKIEKNWACYDRFIEAGKEAGNITILVIYFKGNVKKFVSKVNIDKSIKNEIYEIFSENSDLPAVNLYDLSTSIVILNRKRNKR